MLGPYISSCLETSFDFFWGPKILYGKHYRLLPSFFQQILFQTRLVIEQTLSSDILTSSKMERRWLKKENDLGFSGDYAVNLLIL